MPTDLRDFAGQGCLRCSVVLLGIALLYLMWVYGNLRTTDSMSFQLTSSQAAPCICPPNQVFDDATPSNLEQDGTMPSGGWRLGTGAIVGSLKTQVEIDYPKPNPRVVLVDECLKKMNISSGDQRYEEYNATKIHIIYGVWLPAGQPLVHSTVEPQIYELYSSGLLTRPNTFFHVVLSTNSSDEIIWLKSLAVWQHIPNYEIIHNYWNMFEFPAIRTMWELSCKDPEALYVYFHNKGTRYRQGRHIHEIILTRQIILPWKSILTLLMNQPSIPHLGPGGPGFQFMNFYWTRGSYLSLCEKPVRTYYRYYYEDYLANRVNETQCHLAKGLAAALVEPAVPTPVTSPKMASFGIGTCDTRYIDAQQLLATVLLTTRNELIEP